VNEQLEANSLHHSSPALTSTNAPPLELLVFNIEEVWFGLPLGSVERVVDITNTHNDFSALANVEQLDLHDWLFGSKLVMATAWMIFKDALGTLYGIPVDPVPTLVVVPIDRIRQLPHDVRTNSPLGIASHVARVNEPTRELTVFILEDPLELLRTVGSLI
jgi:hypothetical protein